MSEERIIKVDYEDEMKKSYIDYAMSVIVQRAIPDVRDGLKPVHRRILYAMQELHLTPDKQYRKSARIVGDTMGKYHPHGDASIYGAMVRMAQDYSLLVPLVDGHGNFGSIDGDSAAAMRYTEAKLAKPAMEILKDMDKNVVDYRNNFDDSLKEPIVLPSRFPNLLVNGTSGIAVGMKADIPPHNLNEVINGCKKYIDNEDITISQLRKYIKGPDFPTGGTIINKSDLDSMYETGNGKVRVRAKICTEDAGYGKTNLVITEIPYSFSGSKTKLIESLIEMAKDKKLEELSDVRDESSKDGIRIILEAKRGIDIDNLISKLYTRTKLEDTVSVNFLAIVDSRPEVLNLKEMIKHFIDFQREINIRKHNYLLEKSNARKEIVDGLIEAQDIMDLIIEILRGSKDLKTAKDCLISGKVDGIKFKTKKSIKEASKLSFTENQADAILDMRLHKLIGLELEKLQNEQKELMKKIKFYAKILSDKDELNKLIKSELDEIKKQFGAKRKTVIEEIIEEKYEEKFIEEELYVLIDKFGYVKTIDAPNYNRCNAETLEEYNTVLKILNTDKLSMFTEEGNLHQIKVLDIPNLKIKDKGVLIDTICDVGKEKVILLTNYEEIRDKKLLFLTEQGYTKVVDGSEFESIRRNINSTKLNEGDRVIKVTPIDLSEINNMVVVSNKDYVLKFETSEIPEQKKNAIGVRTLKLEENEIVIGVYLLSEDDNTEIKINEKMVNLKRMNCKKRNSKGVKR